LSEFDPAAQRIVCQPSNASVRDDIGCPKRHDNQTAEPKWALERLLNGDRNIFRISCAADSRASGVADASPVVGGPERY
jgi:hypothetical protein